MRVANKNKYDLLLYVPKDDFFVSVFFIFVTV